MGKLLVFEEPRTGFDYSEGSIALTVSVVIEPYATSLETVPMRTADHQVAEFPAIE